MATTTYFDVQLPGSGAQDWVTLLNRALSTITEKMVLQQLPTGVTMRWGDIAGGKYLEVSATGVKVVGGLDLGIVPTKNLRPQQGTSFPVDYWLGMLFLRTDTETLYFRGAVDWVAIGTVDVSAVGGLVLTDLGVDLGSMVVSDGAAGVTNVVPGADNTVLISDSGSASGWSLSTVLALLGFELAKGEIPIGLGTSTAGALAPGADDTLLVADSGEAEGLRWATIETILTAIIADHGQLLVQGLSGPEGAPAPASNDRVLVSDSATSAGVKWVEQSELGAIPGTRTRVAGDLYLHANYI